jgi:methionine-R-sulfoxide reductase
MALDWREVMRRAEKGNPAPERRVELTLDAWRTRLSPDVFRVTRQQGTERAFSSSMCSVFEPGLYLCACCDSVLFDGTRKFESGTGWPSFTTPYSDAAVSYHLDEAYGMIRIETCCAVCDAHLGHVFPDGPRDQGGLRYCMNALALRKAKQSE